MVTCPCIYLYLALPGAKRNVQKLICTPIQRALGSNFAKINRLNFDCQNLQPVHADKNRRECGGMPSSYFEESAT